MTPNFIDIRITTSLFEKRMAKYWHLGFFETRELIFDKTEHYIGGFYLDYNQDIAIGSEEYYE